MRHRTLVRLLSVLTMIIGLLAPATSAHATVLVCMWRVTAAGNGQIARYGVVHTAPAAFTMHTGDLESVVKTAPTTNSDGLLWLPDDTAQGVYLPYQQISTGTYYLQFAGYCGPVGE